ncbi:hypothetical protein ABT063_03010 [Streptomyces sp. NPDC002838]|uniref:hypothetical protein n=1 Tax=Streptomyces sp. NPDC002838 TaxID=3154436 RepID=UPI003323036C
MPDACTLPTAEQPLRVAEFDALFADALLGVDRPQPGHVRLVLNEAAEERARELAQRETNCCSFLTFAFHSDGQGRLLMDISAPARHTAVVEALAVRAEAAKAAP